MSGNDGMPEGTETEGQVADAYTGNWVDSYAPAWTRPYLRLSRADRPIGTWLLLLPCWWGLALAGTMDGFVLFDLWIAIGCGIGAFFMRGAGCTWNDITDRNYDGKVERTKSRPIPSGQVSVKQALVWMVLQMLIGGLVLVTFNVTTIILAISSLVLVAIYPFAKRFTWWPQMFLGLAFNWGVLVAWTAHRGTLEAPAILLYIAGIIWTLFYDTIYAHQDKEDDAMIGVKSTARLFGENTASWLRRFLILSVTIMALAVIGALLPQGNILSLVIALGGPWAFGMHLMTQIRRLNINDPDACLNLFRENRNTGVIPALFFAVSAML